MSLLSSIFTDFNKARPVYAGVETPAPNSPQPKEVETAVIGGGLLGLSTALPLAEVGHSVVVIEARKIGNGPSGRSGGQLWPGFEGTLGEMKEEFGDNLAISAWNLVHEALRTVHERIATRADKADFRPGVLLTSKTTPQAEWIEEEIKVFQESGFKFASLISADQIKNYVNTDLYLNGILYKGEEGQQYGHLNPLKYTQTVAQLAEQKGAKLVEDAPAQSVRALEDGSYIVTTPKGEIKAQNVVLATGVDFMRPKGVGYDLVPRNHVPVKTIILATEPIPEKLAREMLPGDACFCDAADAAMNYGRLIPENGRPGYYRLTFGGADALAQAQAAFDAVKIEKEMRAMFPQLGREGIKIETVWGGDSDLTRNALPYLLNPREGLYTAGGFSGQGMVTTTLYGDAIAEKILGKETTKFETLQQLNPEAYANNPIVAKWQAAKELVPMAVEAAKEERAERPLRKARATQTLTDG